jgi:hypothetical protein
MLDFLHKISNGLEDWSSRHAHIIALLEAISTTGAVIVALTTSYVAKRNGKPRLKADVGLKIIIHGDGRSLRTAPAYVTVQLTNTGTMPVRLHSTFFSWRMSFMRTAWLVMPISEQGDGIIAQHAFPFVLQPWTSVTIFLTSLERFRADIMPAIFNNGRFGRRITGWLLSGIVYTDDGSQFRTTFGNSFRKELTKAINVPTMNV